MSATEITTIPNRPQGQPVFDFQLSDGSYCRVEMTKVSNDGETLAMNGWAFQIDAQGAPVLSTAKASPVATRDYTRTVPLSSILAKTATLYDGWSYYVPKDGETITASTLPSGWTSGSGAPSGAPSGGIGTFYYDTSADKPWEYKRGALVYQAQALAETLEAQIENAQAMASVGL